jgi:hypothetical protein
MTTTTITTATRPARESGTFRIGGDLPVVRLGFGAMRLTGPGIWGEPRDRRPVWGAVRFFRRPVADRTPTVGVNGTSTVPRRIVFPLDNSARSENALRYVAELASATEARLILVSADQPAHHGPGHAHDALVAAIDRQKPDLIVMPTDRSCRITVG